MSDNLSIIKQPPTVNLIDEGTYFDVQSLRDWQEVEASVAIALPNDQSLYLDGLMYLQLGANTYDFTFKATPDESGLQLRTWDSGENYSAFITHLIEDLRGNYYLNINYTMAYTGTGLQFTARYPGAEYDVSLNYSDITGLAEESIVSGSAGSMPADYRIYVAPALSVNADVGLPIGQELAPVDDENTAYTDLSEYFKNLLESHFTFPYDGNIVSEVENGVVHYFIRYAEFMDDQVQKIFSTLYTETFMVKGGLSEIDSQYYKDNGYNYFDDPLNQIRFLTWAPVEKISYPGVTEKLYWLTSGKGDSKLMMKVTTAAGETISELADITAGGYTIIEIQLNTDYLITDPVEDVISYTIYLEDLSANIISEERVFVLDHTVYKNYRTIIFENSLGGFDCITCTGDMSVVNSINRAEAEVWTDEMFKTDVLYSKIRPTYSLSTGWLNGLPAKKWLEDLVNSTNAYLVFGENLIPIILETSKMPLFEDREYMYSLDIMFKSAYNNKHVSNSITEEITFLTDENSVLLTDENDNIFNT